MPVAVESESMSRQHHRVSTILELPGARWLDQVISTLYVATVASFEDEESGQHPRDLNQLDRQRMARLCGCGQLRWRWDPLPHSVIKDLILIAATAISDNAKCHPIHC